MFAHQPSRKFTITFFNRVHDGLVEGECVLEFYELRGDEHHLCHGSMDVVKEAAGGAVLGRPENGAVEEQIGRDELELVVGAVLEIEDGLPQHRDVFRSGALSGEASEAGLHEKTQFGEVFDGGVVEQEEELHRHGEYRCDIGIEIAAIADTLRNDTQNLKHFEGLAQGRSRDFEVCREFALGRESVALTQFALTQHLLELRDEPLRDVVFSWRLPRQVHLFR